MDSYFEAVLELRVPHEFRTRNSATADIRNQEQTKIDFTSRYRIEMNSKHGNGWDCIENLNWMQ